MLTLTGPIMLFALRDEDGGLLFSVHPEWRMMVRVKHVVPLEALLDDFKERAKRHPDELFRQISSLGVGLLQTRETGENLDEFPSLRDLFLSFIQLK